MMQAAWRQDINSEYQSRYKYVVQHFMKQSVVSSVVVILQNLLFMTAIDSAGSHSEGSHSEGSQAPWIQKHQSDMIPTYPIPYSNHLKNQATTMGTSPL